MSVDCTALLNQRHFSDPAAADGRQSWMTEYPHDRNETMSFDEITRYNCGQNSAGASRRIAVVTYGNGVVTAMQAVAGMSANESDGVVVIDSPYLSAVPQQLREAVSEFDIVLFADICKDGPGAPLLAHACTLHNEGRLPPAWCASSCVLSISSLGAVVESSMHTVCDHIRGTVAAARAYNPLGSMITFLNEEDIVAALRRLRQSCI